MRTTPVPGPRGVLEVDWAFFGELCRALALKVARETLSQFIAEGPSEAELVQAKSNLTGGFPLRIDSNKKILDYLSMIGFYNLPLDYLDTWVAKVDAVDVAVVKQAFQRRVHPEKLATVIVGAKKAP